MLAFSLTLWPSLAGAQDQQLHDLYTKAQAAQQAGNFPQAAAHYEQIIKLRPDLAEAHANLGSIYYQMRQDDKAARALKAALQYKPDLAAPRFFLGVIATRQRQYPAAISHLEEAARLDPTNLVVQMYLGSAYLSIGGYESAVTAFEKALSQPDFRADAFYHLNQAYGELSRQTLARLQKDFPSSFFLSLARAHFHEGRKDWAEAEKAYGAALEQRPDYPALRQRLAWVKERQGGTESQAPPLMPEPPTMLSMLYAPPDPAAIMPLLDATRKRLARNASSKGEEEIYRRAEDYQIASYLAARWISDNDPDSYRAHQLRAQLHEARGETDEAVKEYRAALRLKPDLQNVRFAIGTLLWSLSRFDEALPELQAELKINPNHPEAHYEIGDILQTAGRQDEAKKHLLEALRLKPDLSEAHLAIERIYFAEGEYDKALEQMKTLASISPKDPTPRYRMSMIYRRLGETELARKELLEFQSLQKR